MDAFMVILGLFGSLVLAGLYIENHVSLFLVVPAGILLWGIVIAVCRHKGGARSYMGIGAHLFGKRESANGYITTKWIVICFIPIFPVATYEVFEEGQFEEHRSVMFYDSSQSIRYRMLPGFCWRQILLTLLIGWSIGAAIIYLIIRGQQ